MLCISDPDDHSRPRLFSNSGSGVKLSVNIPAEPTVLSALGRWIALRMMASGSFGGSTVMLKLYIYGYVNRVQSSRRLERECKRNGPAIRKVCREFIVVCGPAGLLAATTVAIDRSKFKAVNSRDRNFTKAEAAKRLEQIKASRSEDTQISLTDPDARSMQGTGKTTGTVGYNVQCAVETKHNLIVAHEVTNAVNDRSPAWLSRQKRPLAPKPSRPSPTAVITAARRILGVRKLLQATRL